MPDFQPFPALRYDQGIDLPAVLAPPYDVLSDLDTERLHALSAFNITHIDVPDNQDYGHAADVLRAWVADGTLCPDDSDTLSIYRLSFIDSAGNPREIVGVLGGLEVVDAPVGGGPGGPGDGAGGSRDGAGVSRDGATATGSGSGTAGDGSTSRRRTTVLPHEQTTPKASTDRLELMRATAANTSPVWGLSLASGLAAALEDPAEFMGSIDVEGVTHTLERITDPERTAAIQTILAADDVLIADGHHRYSVSRQYRDEVRAATGRTDTRAEQTLTFVNELIEDQLSIEAIHRLYAGVTAEALRAGLETCFELSPLTAGTAGGVTPATLGEMVTSGRMVLLWPDGSAEWMAPKPGVFDGIRNLDGLWLETALQGVQVDVTYQHGLSEMVNTVASGHFTAGILIRPTSIDEIRRTAREGLLMPPKSTFFTPKLLTGWVIRPTEPVVQNDTSTNSDQD
ncbi:MAG: DUF1015 domain-containing protein [Propionibacteriaceae bacterium]|nr:DUF1015 domain-containing protein [Propionibacteriaceae bacterium]